MSTRALAHAALFGLAAAALCWACGQADASGGNASPERIAALVRDLGSDKFAVREKATRQLIEMGIVTREALHRAATDPDAEVRVRARAVLDAVRESDFEQRLEAFSADYDGSHHRTLPAWERFGEQFGASRLSRELFVEMQRAEPELLEALAAGPKQASEALARRASDILDSQRETHLGLGTLASFLFVGAADGVTVDEQGSGQLFPYVVQLTYQRNNKSEYWPAVLKKMVGRWIAKDTTPSTANQNLVLAAHLELKPEALAVAARILASDDKRLNGRQIAILVVGRFGDKSHAAILEKVLDDAAPCPAQPGESLPGATQLQIRDVALSVLVQITDQDLRQYGGVSEQPYGAMGFQTTTLIFADDQARQAALAKWTAWRAAHPDS
jgi:hypothetical protein